MQLGRFLSQLAHGVNLTQFCDQAAVSVQLISTDGMEQPFFQSYRSTQNNNREGTFFSFRKNSWSKDHGENVPVLLEFLPSHSTHVNSELHTTLVSQRHRKHSAPASCTWGLPHLGREEKGWAGKQESWPCTLQGWSPRACPAWGALLCWGCWGRTPRWIIAGGFWEETLARLKTVSQKSHSQ